MHPIFSPSWADRTLPVALVSAWMIASALCGATYPVTSTADSGAGSLRQALLDANDNPGPDRIEFSISGSGVRTIAPSAPLPAITDAVVIDGTTQPGFAGSPLIELNGAGAGPVAGLRLLAGNTTVRGLVLNRFGGDGIRIEGSGTNVIQGNFVGVDATGLLNRGNAQEGIFVSSSWKNTIGGGGPNEPNVISGNADAGIYILSGGQNTISGNRIGVTVSGGASVANGNNGIALYNSPSNNVGGRITALRNVISGNGGSGIYLFGTSSRGNLIEGNYIGLSASGALALSNVADGITISGAPANMIGGTNQGAGNVISGNGKAGVFIAGTTATANELKANRIGSDATGTSALGNNLGGVVLGSAHSNRVGGVESEAGNLISGNAQDGVLLVTNSSGNRIEGNIIGANVSGVASLRNGFNGVTINGAHSNIVGGALNVISGNQFYGVHVLNGSVGNTISGNHVGTDFPGAAALPNRVAGIRLESPATTVGGPERSQRNVISGNSTNGVVVVGLSASNNVISRNYIGLNAAGAVALPNGMAGVGISGAAGNTVAGNVISGNSDAGIYLISNNATSNRVTGNRIGTDSSGWLAVGNRLEGIYVDNCGTNFIGGPAELGNLISANRTRGVYLVNASGNRLQGNWIGLRSDGVGALGNVFHGVEFGAGSRNNLIGGDLPAEANRIAFAQTVYSGVRVRSGASGNAVVGNRILSNGALGIDLGAVNPAVNDACDADTGANDEQNYPVLLKAVSGRGTLVRGSLNSRPNMQYRLQFYASAMSDSSGYGEGSLCIGEHRVTTAANCNVEFSIVLPATVATGEVITATATDDAGNTSEFSRAILVETVPNPTVELAGSGVAVSWPAGTAGLVLKSTASLAPPIQWSPVTATPVQANGKLTVALPLPPAGTNQFFVLAYE